MKINFNRNGKRTTITLPDALISVWCSAHPEIESENELTSKLKISIENTPEPKTGITFQQNVESFLLYDIQSEMENLRLEIERRKQN